MSNAKNSTEKPLPVVLPDGTVFHQVGITTRAATVVRKVPNWREWSHTPEVQLWEACLLSLNLDPHSMKHDRDGWIDGSGGEPFLTDSSFPSNSDKDEYELRLRVLSKNFSNRDFFSPCALNMGSPYKCGVRLSEFATWAVEVMNWPDLPPELVALSRKQSDAPAKNDAPPFAGNAPPMNDGDGCTPIENKAKSKQEADLPPYLTTSDLVACFGGFMGVENPAKVLSEYPKWAARNGALVGRGRRGAPSKAKPEISMWNPVQFALNLLKKKPLPKLDGIGNLTQKHLDTVFSMKSLTKWQPIWIKNKPL